MRAVVVTVKCGVVVGPYHNRLMYSASPMGESWTHRVPYVKCSKVFVGVPHQLAAYTATTDKSVLGKCNMHSSQSSAQCGGIGIGTVCSVVYCCTGKQEAVCEG